MDYVSTYLMFLKSSVLKPNTALKNGLLKNGLYGSVWNCLKKLSLPAPCISESFILTKINLNFYFHTSLWYLKMIYEGL